MSPINPEHFIDKNAKTAIPGEFPLCHNYGCSLRSQTYFSQKEWKEIRSLLHPPAKSALEERSKIAKTIALMERYIGDKTGTDTDVAAASFSKINNQQMDCIDETVNTNQYLRFLESDKLFTWHDVSKPLRRGYFVNGQWPHNTAAIKDKESGQVYAVDSWFRANGGEPYIVTAEKWLAYWRPEHDLKENNSEP